MGLIINEFPLLLFSVLYVGNVPKRSKEPDDGHDLHGERIGRLRVIHF